MDKLGSDNMFQLFQRGQRLISRSRSSAILLVGAAKSGQTTLYNWITGKELRVVEHPFGCRYQTSFESPTNTAEISDDFNSTTICPNVIDLSEDISILDMPSLTTNRDYIGVFVAAYSFKIAFDRLKELKFIVVIDNPKILEASCDGIFKTLVQFLDLFNLGNMNRELRDTLYNSVAIVITKSDPKYQYMSYFNKMLQQLKNPRLCLLKKNFVLQLIESMIENNRLQFFPQAKLQSNLEKSIVIQTLNNKSWNFLSIKEESRLSGTTLTVNPFFYFQKRLTENEIGKAMEAIRSYSKQGKQIGKVLGTILSCIGNYTYKIVQQLDHQISEFPIISFSSVFKEICLCLKENDIYDNKYQNKLPNELQGKNLDLLNQWKVLVKIEKYYQCLCYQSLGVIEKGQYYSEKLINFIKKKLSATLMQSFLFERFFFVVNREIIHFFEIQKFQGYGASQFCNYFNMGLNLSFEEFNYGQLRQLMVNKFNWKNLMVLFGSKAKVIEYQSFYSECVEFFQKYQKSNDMKKHYVEILTAKAQFSLKNDQIIEAVLQLLTGLTYLQQNNLSIYKKLWIQLKIASILKSSQDYNFTKNFVLTKYFTQFGLEKAQQSQQNELRQLQTFPDKEEILAEYHQIKNRLSINHSQNQISQILEKSTELDNVLTAKQLQILFDWQVKENKTNLFVPAEVRQSSEYYSQEQNQSQRRQEKRCNECEFFNQKYQDLRRITNEFIGIKDLNLSCLMSKIDEIHQHINSHRAKYPEQAGNIEAKAEQSDIYEHVIRQIDVMVKEDSKK